MLTDRQDAYGHALWDHLQGQPSVEIVERDDGYFSTAGGTPVYFASCTEWPPYLQKAIGYARGRVLDIGCGAGRHSLHLQEQGHEVVATDISPLALEVCRERGVRETSLTPIEQLGPQLGAFDTLLMLGNNFGLFASAEGARRLLRRFAAMTSTDARLIVESRNPYDTNDPDHMAYHAQNRARGRMGGQVRMRVHYKRYVTPYFDYLLVSPHEMRELVEKAGWRIARLLDSDGAQYAAVIEKAASPSFTPLPPYR